MSEQPRTRQELYDLIRSRGSKQAFVLEEMIRLGFWPTEGTLPNDPADEIRREGELLQELSELRRESNYLHSEKQLRKQALKQRLQESRRKQQETKERREQERRDRAEAWQKRKEREIIYLGEGVSGGLNHQDGNIERLQSYGLPILNDAEQIAVALGISVGELRFLAFHRKTATLSHYIRFKIPKKTGGERLISAPMPRLKKVQHWLLHEILDKVEVHEAVHGFRGDRSILTNARPHIGADVVINFDLKDFFPTISYKRVKGLFRALGYSEAAGTILALLSTEADVEEVELDGKTYFVALGDRHLPQGSPASPALSNIICRRLDKRLSGMATNLGFTYTRYADDLTFSASGENLRYICNILRRTESIIEHEGFAINAEKTRILRRKSSQLEVTGIVVNEYPNIDRKTLKRFRATLYQIEQEGIQGKRWGQSNNIMLSVQGFANFVKMVNPQKGQVFLEQIDRIREKWRLGESKARSVISSPISPPIIEQETSESRSEEILPDGIILECYKQGSKLKIRVISEGYNPTWNVQIPRNLMEEGARYRVTEISESAVGGFYRISGTIQKLSAS
ncbi:reverse transcriptase family protein [Spirulina sp. 06S082]|nr:reverse transcriptase family protein [Spirulina sp. 06S082]MEA5471379.1 reverse transcriptase family protein [Spirulina sp. 06S082]